MSKNIKFVFNIVWKIILKTRVRVIYLSKEANEDLSPIELSDALELIDPDGFGPDRCQVNLLLMRGSNSYLESLKSISYQKMK